MSSDSFIGIIPGETDSLGRVSTWYVAHGMMPDIEDPKREKAWKKIVRETTLPYSSRESALVAAHNMTNEETVLEYGVIDFAYKRFAERINTN